MITAVDTNILMDVIGAYTGLYAESSNLLQKHSSEGRLIMSPVAYSEFLAAFFNGFPDFEAAEMAKDFLSEFGIEIVPFSDEDFILAAKVWRLFTKKKHLLSCPKCGTLNNFSCKKCGLHMSWRNHVITDFLIGAHAQNKAEVLLSRDRAYYKKYFKINVLP